MKTQRHETEEKTTEFNQEIYTDQRIAVFIDVQNMFYSAMNIYGKKLDFSEVLKRIVRGRKLVRAIAYIVRSPEVDQSKFISFLSSIGVEIKSKPLKIRPDGTSKGDWDMGIAIDSINIASKVDVIALVSGDGDFAVLLEKLKTFGARVEVYSFPSSTAEVLKDAADLYFPLDSSVLLP